MDLNLHTTPLLDEVSLVIADPRWDSLPDHAQFDLDRTPARVDPKLSDVMAALLKPKKPFVRRI
jgi:hypothetical protein